MTGLLVFPLLALGWLALMDLLGQVTDEPPCDRPG
jgi:hypothetical protein